MGLADHLTSQAASGRHLEVRPKDITTGEDLLTAARLATTAIKTLHTRVEAVIDTPRQGTELVRQVAALVEALPLAVQELSPLTDEAFHYRSTPERSDQADDARSEAISQMWQAHEHLTKAYEPLRALADAMDEIYGSPDR